MVGTSGASITSSIIQKTLFCCFMYWGYCVGFHWEKLFCFSKKKKKKRTVWKSQVYIRIYWSSLWLELHCSSQEIFSGSQTSSRLNIPTTLNVSLLVVFCNLSIILITPAWLLSYFSLFPQIWRTTGAQLSLWCCLVQVITAQHGFPPTPGVVAFYFTPSSKSD